VFWPFRRGRGDGDAGHAETGLAETGLPATGSGSADAPPAVPRGGAWRELPGAMATLPRMPATLDAAFTSTLPSRWQVPPALAPLGHDVRPDVFGGLVSDVARTVQPRTDESPELIWRAAGGPRTQVLGGPARPDAPGRAGSAVASSVPAAAAYRAGDVGSARDTATPTQGAYQASNFTVDRQAGTVSAAGVETADVPADAQGSVAPDAQSGMGAATPPPWADGASPQVFQTRRALPAVDVALDARDRRPVPADATDSTTASPEAAAGLRTEAGQYGSPPSSRIPIGPLAESAAREARPGRDHADSAPAAAPDSGAPAPPDAGPAAPAFGAAASAFSDAAPVNSALDVSAPGSSVGAMPMSAAPATSFESIPSAQRVPTGPSGAPMGMPMAGTSGGQVSAAAAFGALATPTAADAQTPDAGPFADSPTESAATSATAALPPAPTAPSEIAPLISRTNIRRSVSAINQLLPPSRPVDQPVQDIERITGTYAAPVTGLPATAAASVALAATSSSPFAMPSPAAPFPGTPAVPATPTFPSSLSRAMTASPPLAPELPPQAVPMSASAAHAMTPDDVPRSLPVAVASSTPPSAPAPPPAAGPTPPPTADAPSAVSDAGAAAATAGLPSDPAALDLLARRLYGRFSRRLADELLAERERAQLLTDLA
jgi:hypothetical protein